MIGWWCIRHLKKHGEAINRNIESVFETWAEKQKDEKVIGTVEKFLYVLDEEYERQDPLSSDYILDLASNHFNMVRIRNTFENVEVELEHGNVGVAEELLGVRKKVELGTGAIIVPSDDFDVWANAFDPDQLKPLVVFPDPLGAFIGNDFGRDTFVSFTGAFSRGKSWWLMEIAYRAMMQKRRVMLFETGDMAERQIIHRLGQRAARLPRWNREIKYPVKYDDYKEGPIIEGRSLVGIELRSAFRAWRKSDPMGRLRLSVHPSTSLTADQLCGVVRRAEEQGWVPDVIVIDYVDLLAPPKGIREKRDQIDETWKILRRLSQELHCCVVTASQGDALSYKAKVIRGGNFSDSRTKNDHITGGLGINVSDADKEQGVMRLNWMKRRDADFVEGTQIAVAGCLPIGCPMIRACEVEREDIRSE